ncbi:MAG: ABC transporter permease [Lachnospiraceae bacterium]
MNIFGRVTGKTMKQNRVRTLVTIIGVILSTAMFTAVTTFCSSLMDFGKRTFIYRSGNWHVSVESADSLLYEQLKRDTATDLLGSAEQLGYAAVESGNDGKPYLFVLAADAVFLEQMPVHLSMGRLPERDTEILLPEHLYSYGVFSAELGDTLELSLGKRTIDGEQVGQNTPYTEEESFTPQTEQVYTVVGFYERPDFEGYFSPGYTALTYCEGQQVSGGEYFLSVRLHRPGKTMDSYMERNGLEQYEKVNLNWDVLMFSGVWKYNNIAPFVGGMAAILSVLILLGSVSLIYSAFSISVSERTKQFGLLSSVGATKRQIRHCVFTEAGIVSAIGIPLGLLSGVAGMGITLALVGDRFQSILSSPYGMRLSVSVAALVTAALLALFTVFISAWVPAGRATRVTAIEAIRQGKEIAVRGRTVKTSKLVYRLFGLEGMLAEKYFKRSKRKYRTTIISLTLSIVLFVSSSAFCRELSDSVAGGLNTSGFDVMYYVPESQTPEKLLQWFSGAEGIGQMTYSTVRTERMVLEEDSLTKEYREYLEAWNEETNSPPETIQVIGAYYLEDEEYFRLAEQCGMSAEEYKAENPPAIAVNQCSRTLYRIDKENDGKVTERITYELQILAPEVSRITVLAQPEEIEGYRYFGVESDPQTGENCYYYERKDDTEGEESLWVPVTYRSIQVGGKIEEIPFGVSDQGFGGLLLLYPESVRIPEKNDSTYIYFNASDYETMITEIKQVLREHALSDGNLADMRAREKDRRDMILLANVFSYGFITLISLISMANVFHTISTNIALRRRDFAMLRSVGMTAKGLQRMMHYECLLYGSRALLFGLPLSAGMAVLIHRVTNGAVVSDFTLPWAAMGIAAFSVFAVVFVTMLYAMNKIKKDNPMDALKNENI